MGMGMMDVRMVQLPLFVDARAELNEVITDLAARYAGGPWRQAMWYENEKPEGCYRMAVGYLDSEHDNALCGLVLGDKPVDAAVYGHKIAGVSLPFGTLLVKLRQVGDVGISKPVPVANGRTVRVVVKLLVANEI